MRLKQLDPNEVAEIFGLIRLAEGDDPALIERTRKRHAAEARLPNRLFFTTENQTAYVQLLTSGADNDPELADGHTIAHVHDLRVANTHRRKGIAENVMKELESIALKREIKILTLGVDSPNSAARALYEKLGYTEFKSTEGQTPDERCLYLRKTLQK